MLMPRVLAALFVLSASPGVDQAAHSTDLAATVARLQHKYDGLRDFRANFIQIYEGGIIKKKTLERGTVYVKKPGKMRWEYTEPKKVFVSDGLKFYSYLPADRQVIVSDAPSTGEGRSTILFLLGQANLQRDYAITAAPPAPDAGALVSLRLVPRVPQREYDTLVIGVTPDTLRLARLVALDAQGGQSEFRFSDVKENTGLAEKLFVFKIPPGVEVIADDPR